jgi:hypothetical protein
MDPLTLGLGIVGIGLQIFGGMQAQEEAQQQAAISQKIHGLETNVNAQRKQQMELSARRMQLENYRNVQRSRAMGMAAAVNQGAQLGSGIQGGQGQATAQGAFNNLGITQNLELGRTIFGLNDQISGQKSLISQSQSDQATDQGIASLGGAIVKNSGMISNIFGAGTAQFRGGQTMTNPYNSMPMAGINF